MQQDDAPVAERYLIAEAAREATAAPWPKPQTVSLLARVTGMGEGERVTRKDAIAHYIADLKPVGNRFSALAADASVNLAAAAALNEAGKGALTAARPALNDVILIEGAIGALREQRQIYVAAARLLADEGDAVDPPALENIDASFDKIIRELGNTADLLADRVEDDRSQTYAAPEPAITRNLSGI